MHSFNDALDGLLVEEAAGLAVFDGLKSAAFAVGDDGVPQAWASTGVMPKSSSAAKTKAFACCILSLRTSKGW